MPLKTPVPLFDSLKVIAAKKNTPPSVDDGQNNPHRRTDYPQALQFLYSYRGSDATFNAYRREIERLLQWSWFVANKFTFLSNLCHRIEVNIVFLNKIIIKTTTNSKNSL